MTQLATAPDIERIHAPTPEEFQEKFVKLRKPVILTGVADQWPAFHWTRESLEQVAGDAGITVHYDETGNFQRWYNTKPKKRPDHRITLAEFLEILHREPPDRRYYMTEHDLSQVSEKLCGDVDMRRYLGNAKPFLFLGRDTCMPLHYHGTTEAVMCQLHGSKKLTLYGPEWYPYLYPRPWYSQGYVFSKIDGEEQRKMAEHIAEGVDFDRFPKLRDAKPLQFTVHPGEILFIPVHWWHLTAAKGFQISTTYFWLSERKRYHYPSPGLQVHFHEALRLSGLRVRRLLKR